jgi:hypothetical protein
MPASRPGPGRPGAYTGEIPNRGGTEGGQKRTPLCPRGMRCRRTTTPACIRLQARAVTTSERAKREEANTHRGPMRSLGNRDGHSGIGDRSCRIARHGRCIGRKERRRSAPVPFEWAPSGVIIGRHASLRGDVVALSGPSSMSAARNVTVGVPRWHGARRSSARSGSVITAGGDRGERRRLGPGTAGKARGGKHPRREHHMSPCPVVLRPRPSLQPGHTRRVEGSGAPLSWGPLKCGTRSQTAPAPAARRATTCRVLTGLAEDRSSATTGSGRLRRASAETAVHV